jgi:hypothetical protein
MGGLMHCVETTGRRGKLEKTRRVVDSFGRSPILLKTGGSVNPEESGDDP